MKAPDQEHLAQFISIGLRLLSLRLLTLVGLVLDAAMFGWAMWAGGYDRLAVAGVFAVATWTLIHLRGQRNE
jgi:hypothetical protein